MLAKMIPRRMHLPVACDMVFSSEGRGVGQPHFSRGKHLLSLPKFRLHRFPYFLLPLPTGFHFFSKAQFQKIYILLPHGPRSSQTGTSGALLRLFSQSQSLDTNRYSKFPPLVMTREDQLVQQDCENYSATYGFRTDLQQQVEYQSVCSYISEPRKVVFPWV